MDPLRQMPLILVAFVQGEEKSGEVWIEGDKIWSVPLPVNPLFLPPPHPEVLPIFSLVASASATMLYNACQDLGTSTWIQALLLVKLVFHWQTSRIGLTVSCCPVFRSPGQSFSDSWDKKSFSSTSEHGLMSTHPAKPVFCQDRFCLRHNQAFSMLLEGHTQTQSRPGSLSCIPKDKLQTGLCTPKCFCFFCAKSSNCTCSGSGTWSPSLQRQETCTRLEVGLLPA